MKRKFTFHSIKRANGDKETSLSYESDKNDYSDNVGLSLFASMGKYLVSIIIKFVLANPKLVISFIEEIVNRLFYSIKNRTFFLRDKNNVYRRIYQ